MIYISDKARNEVFWWINSVDVCLHIVMRIPDIIKHTYTGLSGWDLTNGKYPYRGL